MLPSLTTTCIPVSLLFSCNIVNTAARMESNSLANMIQVSQSTADELILKGKESWLSPRSDLVNAKGKGMLQTYFVNPTSGYSNTVSESVRSINVTARTSHSTTSAD